MRCANCGKEIINGVVQRGEAFCSEECAEKLRTSRADGRANDEGFASYEDMMEHYGASVAG